LLVTCLNALGNHDGDGAGNTVVLSGILSHVVVVLLEQRRIIGNRIDAGDIPMLVSGGNSGRGLERGPAHTVNKHFSSPVVFVLLCFSVTGPVPSRSWK